MRALLIEDDAETAHEITAEMIDRGFQVDWAASGIEGLDKADEAASIVRPCVLCSTVISQD